MNKAVKLKNDNYLDSTSIIHGNKKLSDIIENLISKLEKNLITVSTSSNTTLNQETTQLYFDTCSQRIGTKLSLENGKIKIGKDVSKIKVSANIFYDNLYNTAYIWSYIQKNGHSVSSAIAGGTTGLFHNSSAITSQPIDVQEGDLISILCGNPSFAVESYCVDVRWGSSNTWLTVEVIE